MSQDVMNKSELIDSIAAKSNLTKKDSEAALNAFIETVKESLVKENSVSLIGFGSFLVRDRAERQGKNPRTGESLTIPASKVPAFKPGKGLKDAVNVPKATKKAPTKKKK